MNSWLESGVVQQLEQLSDSTLRSKMRSGQLRWRFKPGAARLRNGVAPRQISIACLSAHAQMKLAHARLAEPAPTSIILASEAGAQASMFTTLPPIPEKERLVPNAEQTAIAQRKLEVIRPLLDRASGQVSAIRLADGRVVGTLEEFAAYIGEQHRVSARTVLRWYARFKSRGFEGLATTARTDRNKSRYFQQFPAAAEFVLRKRIGERLSVALTYDGLVRECARLKVPAPSYETVRRYLESLPGPVKIMALEGARSYDNKCSPYMPQDYRSVAPGALFVADHCRHDCFTVASDDWFPGARPGVPIRLWLTALMDWASRKIVGAAWSLVPSSDSISSALRQAIETCGIPDAILLDNGLDFSSIHRISFSPEAQGVLVRLGIRAVTSLPYNARAKNIERFFGTLHARFDLLFPTYCGNSPSHRPQECEALLREHQRLSKAGQSHLSRLPNATEFIELAKQWIFTEYNNRPHSGQEMQGKSPNAVWSAVEHRRVPDNPHLLDVLMWQRQKRKVTSGGCVQLYNQRYEPVDEYDKDGKVILPSAANLFMEIDRDVMVACDPSNLGDAIALDLDGQVIGRLQAQKLIARGPVAREEVKAGMRKQRRFARVVKDYVSFLSEGHTTELDHLRGRAGVSTLKRLPAAPEVMPRARAVNDDLCVEEIVERFLKRREAPYIEDIVSNFMKEGE